MERDGRQSDYGVRNPRKKRELRRTINDGSYISARVKKWRGVMEPR